MSRHRSAKRNRPAEGTWMSRPTLSPEARWAVADGAAGAENPKVEAENGREGRRNLIPTERQQ
eukprot:11446375-Alexandrium_andersonii.AAC.1